MNTDSKQLLIAQWQTLHNSHENYEHYALIIKLVTIVMTVLALAFSINTLTLLLILATLWMQEGIWKTYQQRAVSAIIAIEDKLAPTQLEQLEQKNELTKAHLVYTQWQANRPNSTALIAEYIQNALKPTVLYPYFPLMLVVVIF
ncbi:hypothetical protein [Colwellia ponticola]|uniref:Uncharacterized protein n=1 Tax=Colwellia ponticola TaxID=2304625 RepID=A0A8H2JMS0_9GAMM|nr:hypothetical protein [Colwellia ponticola]TMM44910.1 hypothetical protein FCS21_10510 [Colwellia ponticola]